jgi:hypothetical protein
MSNDGMPSVQGVTRRVTRSQTRDGIRAAVRETSVGEQVIFCKLIRDGVLRHLNPWKLSDLQRVLEMRCFGGLLSDEDLKEVYFQRMWGFKEREFVLAGWREMSVEEMKDEIRSSLEYRVLKLTPGMEEHLMSLGTREEIMREYGMLAYVPREIADNAMCGVWALRQIREVGVENLSGSTASGISLLWHRCYEYLCSAGADFSIIRSLYEVRPPTAFVDDCRPQWVCDEGVVDAARRGHLDIVEGLIGTLGHDVHAVTADGMTALMVAAQEGHTDIVHALAGKYNANVDDGESSIVRTALMIAAENGHTDIVHALAGTYNANVEAVDDEGYTALMCAAMNGRADCVNILAGTYNADVEAGAGYTALMLAAEEGHTDVVNILAGTYNANVDGIGPARMSRESLHAMIYEVGLDAYVPSVQAALRRYIDEETSDTYTHDETGGDVEGAGVVDMDVAGDGDVMDATAFEDVEWGEAFMRLARSHYSN